MYQLMYYTKTDKTLRVRTQIEYNRVFRFQMLRLTKKLDYVSVKSPPTET